MFFFSLLNFFGCNDKWKLRRQQERHTYTFHTVHKDTGKHTHTHTSSRTVPQVARAWVCGPGWCQSPGPQSRRCRSLVAGRGDTCDRRAARGAQPLLMSSPPAPDRTHTNTKMGQNNQAEKTQILLPAFFIFIIIIISDALMLKGHRLKFPLHLIYPPLLRDKGAICGSA